MQEQDSAKLLEQKINHENNSISDFDKLSISSESRLADMLKEAERELNALQPEIDKLEKELSRLQELKQTKQKLITLKLSIKSILNNFSKNIEKQEFSNLSLAFNSTKPFGSIKQKSLAAIQTENTSPIKGTFYPDSAFQQAEGILRQKTSTNYEIFRAIVFSGGRASTQEIKDYLVQHKITQPVSGEGFENVPMTDISARANYLIKKGLVVPDGRGYFRSTVGWEEVLPSIQ